MDERTGEQWRDIPGFPNYQVSDLGRVWSRFRPHSGPEIMEMKIGDAGYHEVTLSRLPERPWSVRVYRLVAAAFLGPKPEWATLIRHYDGNPLNSAASNLRWGTFSDNEQDKVRHGRHHFANKTHCPQGHPYDEANTISNGTKSGRRCRECHRLRQSARYHAKVAAANGG